MVSHGEISQALMTPTTKKSFLDNYTMKHRELTKRQREYKKMLSARLKTREETIVEKSYENTIERLRHERNELRAQIWVATGTTHVRDNNHNLEEIKCHVNCQEHLSATIQKLKTNITNMERQIGRVDRQCYDLNLKTIPDSLHQAHVEHARKKLSILENQLEVGIKRECGFAATNAGLREHLEMMLNHRAFFNECYSKLVLKLNSDKKYLIDLIEYACNTFENCIEVHEKLDLVGKKEIKEREARKLEMQGIQRKIAATEEVNSFLGSKGKPRPLADLLPKEYRRREEFRRVHNRKINLYNDVINKILNYTNSQNVEDVIEKFQKQESLYYSYFTYANEMSFHMTLLNNTVNRLYSDVNMLKADNRSKYAQQLETIANLEAKLEKKRKENADLQATRQSVDTRIANLLHGIEFVFGACRADASPLLLLLGDHENVNLVNVRRFLKILEMRLMNIIATVYVMERADDKRSPDEYVVKELDRIIEYTTGINDVVLTQQCPECAEGDAFNVDDGGDDGVAVNTIEEAKKKLYEKVQQPEMQYRLHSLSQCRLPHSRILTAKRNG